jgi:hypothetical protein
MNKRLLAGVAAAGIIGGGVYGFAATLTPTSDTVGAGNTTVASCDTDGVNVDYTSAWDTNRYEVASVTVSGIDASCIGDNIGVTLLGETSPKTATQQTVAGASETFDVSALNVGATVLNNVHVVIAG